VGRVQDVVTAVQVDSAHQQLVWSLAPAAAVAGCHVYADRGPGRRRRRYWIGYTGGTSMPLPRTADGVAWRVQPVRRDGTTWPVQACVAATAHTPTAPEHVA
jgi:hypothetical protein